MTSGNRLAAWLSLVVIVALGLGADKVTPIVPKKPIEISVPIASIGGTSKKIDVSLVAVVATDETNYRVRYGSDRWHTLKLADAKALAAAVEKSPTL
jgi:hypothetical protein